MVLTPSAVANEWKCKHSLFSQQQSQRWPSQRKQQYISCTKRTVHLRASCLPNAPLIRSGLASLGVLPQRRGGSSARHTAMALWDTAELPSVVAAVPDHVCPKENGSLKVEALRGAATIRPRFIALLHSATWLALDQIYTAWGREINFSLYDGWRK